jgi:acetoacetate decarboxylase
VSEVTGFFYPRTATGRASLLPPPPWHYSGDLLTVEYRTDPARVAELLPEPLRPAPEDPGAVAIIWADWQSCGGGGEELLDPVRAQYKECLVVVRCSFAGQVYSRCVYIWVDSDFALARGLHQGYPKKLGSMYQTRPHPFGRAAPRIAPGGQFGATLAAGDRRLAQAVVTIREQSQTSGFVNAHPMAHHRWMPSVEKGAPDALDELVASGSASVDAGPAWRGDASLELFGSPTEELSRLEIREILGGYYRQVGMTWDGGKVLRRGRPAGSTGMPAGRTGMPAEPGGMPAEPGGMRATERGRPAETSQSR